MQELDQVLNGNHALTSDTEKAAKSLISGQTPITWLKIWDGPEQASTYITMVVDKTSALTTWLKLVR